MGVYVKIIKIEKSVIPRYDTSVLKIGDIVAGDETGIVQVRLKDDIIDVLEVGDVIAIRNGRVIIAKSHIRLEIDRWGKITKEDQSLITEINEENDISANEYVMKVSKSNN